MDAMEKFREEVRRFFESLWPAEEKPLVFGEGNWQSPPVMLIGEAPWKAFCRHFHCGGRKFIFPTWSRCAR